MKKQRQSYDDNIVFQVAELFFRGLKVREIAEKLKLSRESVYPLLAKARDHNLIRLVPPVEQAMTDAIAKKFHTDPDSISVIDVDGFHFGEQVAAAAADLVLDLIKQMARRGRDPVRLGLGPGRATLDFSRSLGKKLGTDPEAPRVKLFAIGAGCPASFPEYASTSFFNLFPRTVVTDCLGLFAETIVPARDFDTIRKRPGVKEAFRERDDIDVVVTAMGDIDDPHDLLRTFMDQAGTSVETLKSRGWVGNVQYRPYSDAGPILQKGDEMRAVTLFELEDFARLVERKNKHVVLIARQCGACGKSRGRVLRPLLTVPRLKVWSEIVMDITTARDLLRAHPGEAD